MVSVIFPEHTIYVQSVFINVSNYPYQHGNLKI